MHPTNEQLVNAVLNPGTADAACVQAHARECSRCREELGRLKAADNRAARLLSTLDEDPAIPDVNVLIRRVHQRTARRRRWTVGIATAALCVVAVSALAMPRSMLRDMWAALGSSRAKPTNNAASGTASRQTGISLRPATRLRIHFQYAQPTGTLHVRIGPGDLARVTANGGDVAFVVHADTIEIDNAVPAQRYDITIPASVPVVDVDVGGVNVLSKRDTMLSGRAIRRPQGDYVLVFDTRRRPG